MAFEVLRGVEKKRGEPAALLHSSLYTALSATDRDLATEIAYGVLRWRNRLDFVLSHHSKRPLEKLDGSILTALRIGLYQIRFLDRVPDRAAVDEAVRLAHDFASGGAAFVNAVLRNVLRRPGEPTLPSRDTDPLGYLRYGLSHPEWLARRYLEKLGLDDAETRCRRQNEPPPVYVRVSRRINLDKAQKELGVESERVAILPHGLRAYSGKLRGSKLFKEGLAIIQDAGSQLIPYLLEPSEDDVVLDVCAAPGGKATALAEIAHRGRVIALDRRQRRAVVMKDLASELGVTNLVAVAADGRKLPLRQTRPFHRILLDAPCSSLGTLRHNPDIKWRVAERDLKLHQKLQLELLEASARSLESGGRLVYATCSSEREENQDVVRTFLENTPGFRVVLAPESLPEQARHLVSSEGFFETTPERDDMDAYFAAILTRD
jgi:16S rRNA (cytosine967-C5)-methyltransferase